MNNSAWSQAPFSFLEVKFIKIAWPKDTGEEMAGTLHSGGQNFQSSLITTSPLSPGTLSCHWVNEESEGGLAKCLPCLRWFPPFPGQPCWCRAWKWNAVSMLTIDQLSHYLWRSLSIYSMHRESAAQTGHPLRSFPRPSNSFPSVNGFPREGIERVNWLLSELCFFFEGEGIRLHYKGFLKIVLEKCYGSFETCLSWVNVSSV